MIIGGIPRDSAAVPDRRGVVAEFIVKVQAIFRCSHEEREAYQEAARRDGFDSASAWMRWVLNGVVVNGPSGEKPARAFADGMVEQWLLRCVLLTWEATKRQIEASAGADELQSIRDKAGEFMNTLLARSRSEG